MPNIYHALPTTPVTAHTDYMRPLALPEATYVTAPALSIMVDFKYHNPPTINTNRSINDAATEMKAHNLPFLLVVDEEKKVLGVLTSEDVLGEKPVKITQERRIPRNEIEINMVMLPAKDLLAINIDDLQHAKVGHIIQTLRNIKQHVVLVIKTDLETQQQKLRGLFSASLLSKQLDKDITSILSEAQSIAELQHGLHQ